MSQLSLPIVALVGRTNVGKSTLFNRLSEDIKSITFDEPGITRDFIRDTVCWQNRCFELVDTGGISFVKTSDEIELQVRDRALAFLKKADLLLLVTDGQAGLLPEDREIATIIHKLNKPTIVSVNKLDNAFLVTEHTFEFDQLGLKTVIPISAQHGLGIADLLETIVALLPEKESIKDEVEPYCKVTILGKPNVGKSSLMNALLQEERSIVADMPGTTREAIAESIKFYKEDIVLIDTPGVRRPRAVEGKLEDMMVRSSLRSVDQADVVLLVVDSSDARISDQELKLAFYTFQDRYKALIILFNKDDKTTELIKKDLAFSLEEYEYLTNKVITLTISCKTGKNITKILPLIDATYKKYTQKFDDLELIRLIKEALQAKPLYKSGQLLHVFKVKQINNGPITLLLTVNLPQFIGPTQLGFFESILRKKYDLKGIPIKFVVRGMQA